MAPVLGLCPIVPKHRSVRGKWPRDLNEAQEAGLLYTMQMKLASHLCSYLTTKQNSQMSVAFGLRPINMQREGGRKY